MAADKQPESDGGVDVTAGDVGGHRNRHKEGEGVGDRRRDEAGGSGVGRAGYLVVGHGGTRASKDEDEGADELGHRLLEGAGLPELIAVADRHVAEGDVEVVVGAGHDRRANQECLGRDELNDGGVVRLYMENRAWFDWQLVVPVAGGELLSIRLWAVTCVG